MPARAPKDGISFTKAQQEKLDHLSNLLHLFHHRNRNQHRRSIWYRHFSTFRKQLSQLLAETAELNNVPATHLERSRKKKRDELLKTQIQQRLVAWQDVHVRKWHLAFSQLVADGRFAVLGVVLMAALGEMCGVVGVTEGLEGLGDEQVRGVIETFGRELGADEGREANGGREMSDGDDGGEDVGVAVRRAHGEGQGDRKVGGGYDDLSVKAQQEMGRAAEKSFLPGRGEGKTLRRVRRPTEAKPVEARADIRPATDTRPTSPTAPPPVDRVEDTGAPKRSAFPTKPKTTKTIKTKKRKKGDAIDELFSGLG